MLLHVELVETLVGATNGAAVELIDGEVAIRYG